ncbi:MAG: hypothetical protein ACK55I_27540, partial [bacterium]
LVLLDLSDHAHLVLVVPPLVLQVQVLPLLLRLQLVLLQVLHNPGLGLLDLVLDHLDRLVPELPLVPLPVPEERLCPRPEPTLVLQIGIQQVQVCLGQLPKLQGQPRHVLFSRFPALDHVGVVNG